MPAARSDAGSGPAAAPQRVAKLFGGDVQEIAVDDREIGGRGRAQAGREVAVDFEREHPSRAIREREGQRSAARSDFEKGLIG